MTAAADGQATARAPQRQGLGRRPVLLKGDSMEDWATVRPPMAIGGCRRCGVPARGACARTSVAGSTAVSTGGAAWQAGEAARHEPPAPTRPRAARSASRSYPSRRPSRTAAASSRASGRRSPASRRWALSASPRMAMARRLVLGPAVPGAGEADPHRFLFCGLQAALDAPRRDSTVARPRSAATPGVPA